MTNFIAKELAKAKRGLDDAELKRLYEMKKNEKIETEKEKQKMIQLLAKDKEERFGKKFDTNSGSVAGKKEPTAFENCQHYVKSIKTLYPSFRNGDTAKNCLNTIKVVLANIVKNPTEEKYKKVKTTNPNFQERVGKIPYGLKCLIQVGFKEDGEYLVLDNADVDLLSKIVSYLEEELKAFA